MDTHSDSHVENPIIIELNELNNLISKYSKGLCEESQVIRYLEKIKQRTHSNSGLRIPNNISTQLIALENEFNSLKSKVKLPKFKLKAKIPSISNTTSTVETVEVIDRKYEITDREIVITSQNGEKFFIRGNSSFPVVRLEDLNNCSIEILDIVSSVYIKKMNDCNIIIGPCIGSIMIHESYESEFRLTCKQLRIHDSKNIKCYINTAIPPIIENCFGIGYSLNDYMYNEYEAQLRRVEMADLLNSKRHLITDFCWQKSTQSPNWYYL